MPEAFFFYGTLIAGGGNPAVELSLSRLRPMGAGRAQGLLFALDDPAGCYPAMVAGDGVVHGCLMARTPAFSAQDLMALDSYEGADYRRMAVMVHADGAMVRAWAYVWARPLPDDALPLPEGDFLAYVRASGRAVYRDPA
ncbi:gamma-glutamylcyclotransferase [Novosphingobium umbonatum]|uniref:Gamma-glutamylcyclotransferase n=1 Tax=Novosphingobium umbonatum TaxID=1908524 RepID=A0A3S2X3E2_9SPHN|nr:gamma-glutamylcyclotransferase family protein [Novosphingobium umbonatum]RVU04711.1 gamma-glutamylcyclotransferase [Novosphingobium umbonatum]